MKKRTRFIAISLLCLVVGVTIFISCQNTKSVVEKIPETHLQIVPDSIALTIAETFNPSAFFNESNPTNHYPIKSTLNGNNKIKAKFKFNDSYGNPALYIFNFENNSGFLFVSADYQLQPVLAFVQQGEFKKDTVPVGYVKWLQRTMENIEVVRKGLYDNSRASNMAWSNYLYENKVPAGRVNISIMQTQPEPNPCSNSQPPTMVTIGPLLPVTWGQGCTYNNLCPNLSCNISCGTQNAWTGCVATAMAQVINYWHPKNNYNFNYTSMPTTYGNSEVQRLMYNIGLPANVNMQYGCEESGAFSNVVPAALKTNFGFSSANFGTYNYQTVFNDLTSHWPVLLSGFNNVTVTGDWFIIDWYSTTTYYNGHEWVCDGYQQYTGLTPCNSGDISTFLYFHMNWGWHEFTSNPPYNSTDYNGWFAYNDWYISGQTYNFQYNDGMTSEIHL